MSSYPRPTLPYKKIGFYISMGNDELLNYPSRVSKSETEPNKDHIRYPKPHAGSKGFEIREKNEGIGGSKKQKKRSKHNHWIDIKLLILICYYDHINPTYCIMLIE
jgi:hypothetical protein